MLVGSNVGLQIGRGFVRIDVLVAGVVFCPCLFVFSFAMLSPGYSGVVVVLLLCCLRCLWHRLRLDARFCSSGDRA